jgi:hypothetical protein
MRPSGISVQVLCRRRTVALNSTRKRAFWTALFSSTSSKFLFEKGGQVKQKNENI